MKIVAAFLLLIMGCQNFNDPVKQNKSTNDQDSKLLTHEIDLSISDLKFYCKNEKNINFGNHGMLKTWLSIRGKELIFAVNGGMYNKDRSPQGLYIENGNLISPLVTKKEGYGNFYLQPNGVFYIDKDDRAGVVATDGLEDLSDIKYATQSGPMLVIDGKMHSAFRKGSSNLHIRNGVGLLPNGNLLFVMSKEKINFYDLAEYFLQNDCKNALYLDGFVSRTYLPSENWVQEDGDFGVIIAEVR